MKKHLFLITVTSTVLAGPILQMNKAFNSLSGIMPYVLNEESFKDKKNEKEIRKGFSELNSSLKLAGHDSLIKHDLFAPSYALLKQNVEESSKSFNRGKKDFALWQLKEGLSMCLECHSRIPTDHPSSFQNGELTVNHEQWKNPYDLGIAYLIVRRYVDAKAQFMRSIQDHLIKKEEKEILQPFQQILFIQTRIMKDPQGMITIIDDFINKKKLPPYINNTLGSWKKRLQTWETEKVVTGIKNEKELGDFIKRRLEHMKKESFNDVHKVDILLSSGLISSYFFMNQDTASAPVLSYWLGWMEKRLKRDQFLTSGDLYLKQCVRKYPTHPIARECLQEYQESVEFDFSGSSGTHIPKEIQEELDKLKKLIK
ncbi:MAG: hypothetical protein ACLGHN_01655 [Bacteriovoracia bacterium]